MGLLGEVQAAQESKRRAGKACGIHEVREALTKQDAADLDAVLARPLSEIMHTTIAEVLKARGFRVTDQVVAWHRKGKCGCARG